MSPYHESFLKNCIEKYDKHNTSRTYIIIDSEELVGKSYSAVDRSRVVAAYFTVGLSSISIEQSKVGFSSKKRKELKSHLFSRDETIGCFVIGELCRASNRSNAELSGEYILNECVSIIKEAQGWIGGRLILVDSRRALLESLYRPYGFKELQPTGKRTADDEELITSYALLQN